MNRHHGIIGVISNDEAYSKEEAMRRLNISQKFWDKMLDQGPILFGTLVAGVVRVVA